MEYAMNLGALGFWIFIAAIVVAGIWVDSRKRESQQETLRRIVESGQAIDPVIIDKLLAANGSQERVDRGFKVAGLITMSCALGLVALGWALSNFREDLLVLMLGVAALVGFVGIGLYVAGIWYARWQQEDQA